MAYAWLLVLLPFAGSAWIGLRGRRLSEAQIGQIACGAIGLSFIAAVATWLLLAARWSGAPPSLEFHGLMPALSPAASAVRLVGPTWIAVGDLVVRFCLLLDPLSVAMSVMVTGVAFLIHLYARGYMHGDPHFARFFALLNLFVGAMMTLVLAENLPLMFIGWEGVGFCSYMLIGYYTERFSASQAGKKAFIVNRVGDLGFLIGTFLVWRALHDLSFPSIAAEAARSFAPGDGQMTAIALCFFIGACGKSAQFPLYVWLPDAMEGPTPVSALIHAATMVTAGVYLVVRLGVIFALAPLALNVVAVVGLLTALLAALLALVQNDIKRVLAYSTISQLGYMFLAAGVGAYGAAMFHLITHAFFKGLLFLCSGSVIHGMEHALHHAGEHGDPQDMRNMGGLAEKMPTTHWTMVAGAAAISGVPLLSGFFSKDEILFYAGQSSAVLLWIGLAVALLTAFYMFRLIIKTFWQPTRMSPAAYGQVAESAPTMTQPLVVLGILSLAGGVLNLPGEGFFSQWLGKHLLPVLEPAQAILFAHAQHHAFADELRGMVISSVVALAGIALAWSLYRDGAGRMAKVAVRFPGPYAVLVNKYYLDEFYQLAIVQPGVRLSEWLARAFDQEFIDGLVNGVARFFGDSSESLRRYQPGQVRSYALWFCTGAAGLLAAVAATTMPGPVGVVVMVLVVGLVAGTLLVARPRDGA